MLGMCDLHRMKPCSILPALALLVASNLFGQVDTVTQEPEAIPTPNAVPATDQVYTIVEEMPVFPGGENAMFTAMTKQIRYPDSAVKSGVQGVVYVTFVVEVDGSISNIKVLRGIGGGCDEEAVRFIRNMPPWTPGRQNGQPVRTQYNMPIRFTL